MGTRNECFVGCQPASSTGSWHDQQVLGPSTFEVQCGINKLSSTFHSVVAVAMSRLPFSPQNLDQEARTRLIALTADLARKTVRFAGCGGRWIDTVRQSSMWAEDGEWGRYIDPRGLSRNHYEAVSPYLGRESRNRLAEQCLVGELPRRGLNDNAA